MSSYIPAATFEQCLQDNIKLINKLIYQKLYKKYKLPKQDAESLVYVAAWKAWSLQKRDCQDQERAKYAFGTYLENQIRHWYKNYKRDVHIPASHSSVLPQHLVEHESHDDRIINSITLSDALKKLTEIESQIIKFRFFDGKTLEDTGKALDYSPEMIALIQKRAINKLRVFMHDEY